MGRSILSELNLDASSLFVLVITVCAFMIPVLIVLPPVPIRKTDALLQTHSLAGLRKVKSNLITQYAPNHGPKIGKPDAAIQSLLIYPVKSCRGIEVTRSRVLPQGLEFDRLFTFAQLKSPSPTSLDSTSANKSEYKWAFVTQRQLPLLATVKVDLWLPDEMKLRRQSLKCREAFLILRFPWKETGWRGVLSSVLAKLGRGAAAEPEREILLPIDFPSVAEIKEKGYTFENIKIWNEVATALNMSAELPEELQLYLGGSSKLGLFRVDPGKLREVYRTAPTKEVAGYQPVTGFQDAFPLHVMSLSSIQQLSKEVPKDDDLKELDVRRFRANIILTGSEAYEEETWKRVRFQPGKSSLHNDAVFDVSCRTVRCKMPNVDQDTGMRHPREPDRTLRATREIDEGAKGHGCLGMQMTPLFEDASIVKAGSRSGLLGDNSDDEYKLSTWVEVGMALEVEQRGNHKYIPQGS
ncbi:hypothetical protein F5Y16DRAFT_410504 [Xylariaceae sp. FL0255]|nr:hypothetical protein F5Y16DRAFT_410504 [Xylariaceae sp. FL0255]